MSTAAATRADSVDLPAPTSRSDQPTTVPESFWGSLRQLNAFRLFLVTSFIALAVLADRLPLGSQHHLPAFIGVSLFYGMLAIAFAYALHRRRPSFDHQLGIQLVSDILLLTVLMYLSGGNDTGLGLLITVPLAAAGMHARARVTFFLPAIATVAVLAEQSVHLWLREGPSGSFTRAALLSAGFFAVAGLSHVLAKGVLSATRLAGEQAAALASLEKINAQVIQDLPYGVIVIDGTGRVMQSNGRAESLLACTSLPRAPLSRCAPALHELWHDWRGRGEHAWRVFEPNGGHRVRARVLELDPNRSACAAIVIEDLSELEEEAMRMKLAALGRLAANLAHEIRNPLSAIQHASELLREDGGDGANARLTRIIEDNVARLNWLVEDVLSLSRRDRQNREKIDLATFLDEFVGELQRNEGVPPGVLSLEVAAGVGRIEFDRMHLHQVLWNLCRNARRYASLGPASIVLAAYPDGARTLIDVSNDGPAIPPEMQLRLFDPFYTTEKSGSGLGLYIARELAEANGGQLRCIPQTQGARFRVYCPNASD